MAEQYETLEEFLDAEEIEQQDEDTLLWVALGLAYGLMYLLQELNEKLQYSEGLESEIEQLSKFCPMILGLEEEFLESSEIPLSVELLEVLCKVSGSDKTIFMGIT